MVQRSKAKDTRPRAAKYYLNSSIYSSSLGKVATKAYFQLKDFLNKEISLPSAQSLRQDLAHLIPKAKSRKRNRKSKKNQFDKLASAEKKDSKIKDILEKSNVVLATATSVFPFALFPDTVTLDRTKVTITQRDFFFSNKVNSFRIEDILNVTSDVGPFFGSITVVIRVMSTEDHFPINWFRRKDAIHLKHMIHGYVIAQQNKIKVDHLDKDELIETISELGHDSNR